MGLPDAKISGHELQQRLIQGIKQYLRVWNEPVSFDWRGTLVVIAGTLIVFPLISQVPMLGFEWPLYRAGVYDHAYPPWLQIVITPLSLWPWRTGVILLQGILLMTVGVATMNEACRTGNSRLSLSLAVFLALFSAPVPMLMWEGNASIITMFGLLALPFGVPLALVQPHLASWALLARRRWTFFGIGFGVLTLVIWGFWPIQVFGNTDGSLAHPVAMGWLILGWPVLVTGLGLLPFTNADPLRLIAVGAFLSPYVNAVHFVLLLPAIGRVRGRQRIILWLCSWTVILPYAFLTPVSKYMAMLFPLAVWWLLRNQKPALPQSAT